MWDQQSCSLGSYRKQTGKCPPYWIHSRVAKVKEKERKTLYY
jgi:hypothetical protein